MGMVVELNEPAGGLCHEEIPDSLLRSAVEGDPEAREKFWTVALPKLRQLAHRRIPPHLRRLEETEDLVQRSAAKVFQRLQTFEGRDVAYFIAFMRKSIRNLVIDDIRRFSKERPVAIVGTEEANTPSPELGAIESELEEKLEAALTELRKAQPRLYVAQVLRTEFDLGYEEIAEFLNKPSADAARMDVTRARSALSGILARRE